MFKYLGSRFRADGSHLADIKARIVSATATADKMRNVWASKSTPLRLKLRIYKVGVCSKITYGCEAWKLDADACRLLNGANSRMLPHITGHTDHEEASSKSRTFDVVAAIRVRKLKWLGHILRMSPDRLVHKATQHLHATVVKRHDISTRNNTYVNICSGDLLMDVPSKFTWDEFIQLAANREGWRKRVHAIMMENGVSVTMSGEGGKVVSNLPPAQTHTLWQKKAGTRNE